MLRYVPRVLQIVRRGAWSCLAPKSMFLTTVLHCLLKCPHMMLEEARTEGIQATQWASSSQSCHGKMDWVLLGADV